MATKRKVETISMAQAKRRIRKAYEDGYIDAGGSDDAKVKSKEYVTPPVKPKKGYYTLDMLKKAGACESGQNMFREMFGTQAKVTIANAMRVRDTGYSLKEGWLPTKTMRRHFRALEAESVNLEHTEPQSSCQACTAEAKNFVQAFNGK